MTCTLVDPHGNAILDTDNADDIRQHIRDHPTAIIRWETEDGETGSSLVRIPLQVTEDWVAVEGHRPRVPYDEITSVEP